MVEHNPPCIVAPISSMGKSVNTVKPLSCIYLSCSYPHTGTRHQTNKTNLLQPK